jgi:plasmid stabilization system protein ParE
VKLRWSSRALEDLLEIGDYIALDDAAAARRWLTRLRDRARKAAAAPRSGRRVPELDREDIREVFAGTYRIIYRIDARELVVVTVIEGHQLLPSAIDPDAA